MATASRFGAHRSILVLIALACAVGMSDRAPASDRPAVQGGPDEPYVDQHFDQPHERHGRRWHHHLRPFPHEPAHTDLTVGHYTLVSSRRVTGTIFDFTYRARLTNEAPSSGLVALGATARVISHSPATQIVDGELTFGDVPAGHSAPSLDTFTLRHHAFAFDPGALRWSVSARRELAVPSSWAGAWHITLTYRNAATGAVTAVEETDGVIRGDEPVGLAFSGPLATCAGRMTDKTLSLTCELRALPSEPCHLKGALDLTLTRVADAVTGSGAWHAAGHRCEPPVSFGQTLAVAGIRLSTDPGPAPPVASTLLKRFVSQPLFVLFATTN